MIEKYTYVISCSVYMYHVVWLNKTQGSKSLPKRETKHILSLLHTVVEKKSLYPFLWYSLIQCHLVGIKENHLANKIGQSHKILAIILSDFPQMSFKYNHIKPFIWSTGVCCSFIIQNVLKTIKIRTVTERINNNISS